MRTQPYFNIGLKMPSLQLMEDGRIRPSPVPSKCDTVESLISSFCPPSTLLSSILQRLELEKLHFLNTLERPPELIEVWPSSGTHTDLEDRLEAGAMLLLLQRANQHMEASGLSSPLLTGERLSVGHSFISAGVVWLGDCRPWYLAGCWSSSVALVEEASWL